MSKRMSDGTVKDDLDLSRYITDDNLIEFYSYNYDSEDFKAWIAFMNESGFGIEELTNILKDYREFTFCWDIFVDTFDF